MRPCTGFKSGSISGGVFDRATFDEYISFFQEELEPENLLVIDRVRHIDYEWRTIICGKRCITGCQYGSFDVATQKFGFDPSPSFPDRVRVKVEEIVSSITWTPDPIYVLDIAQSDCELSVMEINALSTSGWYDCDIGAIADAICGIMSMEGDQNDHRHERIDSVGSSPPSQK
ncbi:MAG: ATP-grasp domain-containing protein [Promethearchaeota archaeon]